MDSPLKIGSKIYFCYLLAFSVLQILGIKYLPGKSSIVNNFDRAHFRHHATYHSKALKEYFSKNVYFYGAKVVRSPVRESCHVINIKQKVFELNLSTKNAKN